MDFQKLPDIVIMDKESRQKCSIYPLRHRADMRFFESYDHFAQKIHEIPIQEYIFLHIDGISLSQQDAKKPFLLLDASWKRALKIAQLPLLANLAKRSITGFVTAYPRMSKLYPMPVSGLASVEALFLARLIQGREEIDLLNHYYWKTQFLESNQVAISSLRAKL